MVARHGSPSRQTPEDHYPPRPDLKGSALVPLSVFTLLLVLYAATVCPTVGPGDSGELAVVLSTWGVAHAPGYPLLSLVGNLVSLLPFPGEPALILNLFTALLAALAAAVLAAAVIEATGSAGAALVAGLALGVSRAYWEYALVLEVFAMNSLFGAALIYCLARFLRGLRDGHPVLWPIPVSALLMSTAITHHLTLVLVAVPVFVVYVALALRGRKLGLPPGFLRRSVFLSVAAGILGLLPLLYIPLAARGNPPLNWDDATTLDNLVRLLRREDFGSGTLMSPWAVATTLLQSGGSASPLGARHVGLFWAEIPRNFGWLFLLLPLAGLLWTLRRSRELALFLAGFLAMLTIFFLRVNSPVLPLYMGITERFYILPHVMVAFAGGLGMAWLLDALGRRRPPFAVPAVLAVVVVTAGVTAFVNAPHVSMRGNTFTRDIGANFIEGMPPDAIVLSEGDLYHNAFYYQQAALGQRPDLVFIDQQKLTYPWYVNQVRRRGAFHLPEGMRAYSADTLTHVVHWLDLNLGKGGRPVVAVSVRDQSWFRDYRLVPMGLWWRALPRDQVPAPASHAAEFETIVEAWDLRSVDRHYHERSWETAERDIYTRGLGLLSGVKDLAEDLASGRAESGLDPEAAAWFSKALSLSDSSRVSVAAAHLEIYHRALAEGTIDLAPAGGSAALIRKAIALAEKAIADDPSNVPALKTLAVLLRVNPDGYDPKRELEVRGRIADAVPGSVEDVAAYVQLAIDLMNDPARRSLVVKEDLLRRQRTLLERLELAIRVSEAPSLVAQREQWREYLRRLEGL